MRQKFTTLIACLFLLPFAVHAQIIQTVIGNGYGAGSGSGGYSGDGGVANAAELSSCSGISNDGSGNLYIADMGNHVVRRVGVSGIITTFAGNHTAGNEGDGGAATNARLDMPYATVTDVWGNVYISDFSSNVIRKVTPSGTISTYAGTGAAGYSGDGGAATAATLYGPEGMALDNAGNLFIAEAKNNVVRVVYTDGSINTIAGNGFPGYSGNGGQANMASLHFPASVALDVYGNIYIADYLNNCVRKIDTSWTISTCAGTGYPGFAGDGGPAAAAQLFYPSSVSAYGIGELYIADQGNNRVRRIAADGTISTFAGSNTNGYHGDGGPAAGCELSSPKGVFADGLNRLYVADYGNNVIRLVSMTTSVSSVSGPGRMKVYPNPSDGNVTVALPELQEDAVLTLTDILGRKLATRTIAAGAAQDHSFQFGELPAGSYLLRVNEGSQLFRTTIVIR